MHHALSKTAQIYNSIHTLILKLLASCTGLFRCDPRLITHCLSSLDRPALVRREASEADRQDRRLEPETLDDAETADDADGNEGSLDGIMGR
mmetsp:Transcript_80514/g.214966  ORF Transcript_80514/g.214966 Transcript_80514/m.214966 type:complete len:92 (+) Transcript_80514:212-487(+)